MRQVVALFGEAEKGAFKTPHILKALPQLVDQLGNPPKESEGLFFAVQAILYERELIYFRVAEEGFSKIDYLAGLKILQNKPKKINALCLPGVGDAEILEASHIVCRMHRSFLITSQKDLYDYLTSKD
ncbi:MAG: hypothetical protein A3E80_01705 [Chlamydiae bacterium RIFCSPHIGHO2_12_FULL_49_9]|nr:MAG: hypothetical protein A3E80_01705 [Chlamydiae bacterium RIFCSPHIGHO2_12_FULL_49_9]